MTTETRLGVVRGGRDGDRGATGTPVNGRGILGDGTAAPIAPVAPPRYPWPMRCRACSGRQWIGPGDGRLVEAGLCWECWAERAYRAWRDPVWCIVGACAVAAAWAIWELVR